MLCIIEDLMLGIINLATYILDNRSCHLENVEKNVNLLEDEVGV